MMNFLKKLGCRWRARCRSGDITILWPEIVKASKGDLHAARLGFALHCNIDPEWTRDFTEKQVREFAGNLTGFLSDDLMALERLEQQLNNKYE